MQLSDTTTLKRLTFTFWSSNVARITVAVSWTVYVIFFLRLLAPMTLKCCGVWFATRKLTESLSTTRNYWLNCHRGQLGTETRRCQRQPVDNDRARSVSLHSVYYSLRQIRQHCSHCRAFIGRCIDYCNSVLYGTTDNNRRFGQADHSKTSAWTNHAHIL